MQTAIQPPLTKTVRTIPAKPEFTQTAAALRPLKVAAYCRVSTKKDEQHLSYEAQKAFYTDKIMKAPEWQYVDIYADRGITGTSAVKRPDFMRLIRDCKKGKIDLIITKSVQRFARNTVDSLEHVRLLKSMGIGIIFETQGLDTRKMSNEFLLTVYASLAQAESENISANVKWGRQKSFKSGSVHFSYNSFLGYNKGADGRPEIEPEQAEVVRRIYSDFLSGQSRQQIADSLTAEEILTPRGCSIWQSSTVAAILRNEKYCGMAILQKTFVADCISHTIKQNNGELPMYIVENNHPAIIDKGIWNRAQEELTRRSGKRKVKQVGTKTEQGKYSSKYALTELLFCGECGTPYRRVTWSKNGKKKVVWRCISRLDYGKKYCKESPSLDEVVVQDAVLDAIAHAAARNTQVLETLKLHIGIGLSDDNNSGDDDPYAIQARIGEIEAAVTELIKLEAADGNQGTYDSRFEELHAEKCALKAKLEQIRAGTDHAAAAQSRLNGIFTAVDGLRLRPLDWDESLVRQLVECVRVVDKSRLRVAFRFGGEIDAALEA
jgi:DNA invertase Pin-like site-specific DNA recombinase